MKVLAKAIVLGVMSVSMVACQSENSAEKTPPVQNVKVDVETVSLGAIPLKVVVPGAIVPDQKAMISSRLMGYIKDLNVKVGQSVKQGQELFSIDSSDVKSGILKAKSGYQQAEAALLDAKLDYDRFKKLYEEESASKQQFDKISLQYKVAQENLVAAKTNLDQAKSQLQYSNVKAPFNGVVVQKMAVAGDLAAPGNPVLALENRDSLSVQTQVSQDLYSVLRIGDTAEVLIDGQDKPMIGTIYTLVSAADPKTRTHTVKLSLPTSSIDVNSGTFTHVGFKRGDRQTIMVPKSAIVVRSGIQGVFVDENNQANFRMVRLGESIGNNIEVKAGLNLGDVIVVKNNESLLNGDHLVVENKPADVKATDK
ncbi:efflux RND transporter periplasmic adaptor subunit [Hydrogenovibrio sp. JE_KL2]|uniref:efflux RND transporter periplasmic adaptor subunit n=1 Tax=Hydrogenovibrio sp. JE_KL2 TaxID=2651188 RepID=UPI00128C35E6|nr:efflux RND transporter periplasmic adaptor subunit [Hydrogenovibrio sp. JE_KL2]MPQ76768.1 efflux RND transporter periplasmic adaptor subunit [Hydrogenovibrio sp. JE_KL2]